MIHPIDWKLANEWASEPIPVESSVEWNSDVVENAARAYCQLARSLVAWRKLESSGLTRKRLKAMADLLAIAESISEGMS